MEFHYHFLFKLLLTFICANVPPCTNKPIKRVSVNDKIVNLLSLSITFSLSISFPFSLSTSYLLSKSYITPELPCEPPNQLQIGKMHHPSNFAAFKHGCLLLILLIKIESFLEEPRHIKGNIGNLR